MRLNGTEEKLGVDAGVMEMRMELHKSVGRERRKREVARQLPRAEERRLEGGGTFKGTTFCSGCLCGGTNRPKRGWSHLAGSPRDTSCNNKQSGEGQGTKIQECGKWSEQQLGCKMKSQNCLFSNLYHGEHSGPAGKG